MDDKDKIKEFDNNVYSAITKKFMPEIRLDEPITGDRIVGTLVLVFLATVFVMSLWDAYSVREYNKPLIDFTYEEHL